MDDAFLVRRGQRIRPGPSTWKLGSYPDGGEALPVGGLSWYEAAAFSEFAGKELPTVYHWYQADTAGDLQLLPGLVLATTNHEGTGPRRADASGSVSAYGAIDMAGNVREWSANASNGSTRIALGGAWSDPAYQYLFADVRPPFDRSPGNGFRAIKRLEKEAPSVADAPLDARRVRDRAAARPASDAEFAIFRRFYDRPPVPLDQRIESTDDSSPHWTKQRISFAAGHSNERMTALLYLPRSTRPPYQVVIQMAGAATFYRRSSATEKDIFGWSYAEYLIRGGRAVMIPIWKGSYERADGFHPLQSEWPSYREHVSQWVAELHQSVDYLHTGPDLASHAIGFQGISNGAIWAPISAGNDKEVHFWDVATGKRGASLADRLLATFAVAFTADGRHLVMGAANGAIEIVDVEKASVIRRLPPETWAVVSTAFSPDGRWIGAAYMNVDTRPCRHQSQWGTWPQGGSCGGSRPGSSCNGRRLHRSRAAAVHHLEGSGVDRLGGRRRTRVRPPLARTSDVRPMNIRVISPGGSLTRRLECGSGSMPPRPRIPSARGR